MKEVKEWAIAIIIGLLLAGTLKTFVFSPVRISGQSMENTFHDHDVVVMEKITQELHKLKIGDVVIIKSPKVQEEDQTIIKRIEGFAGDKIAVKNGYLYRNGKKIIEPYIKEKMVQDFPEMTVPKGDVFVMGDNRNNSADSRYFGPFKLSEIQGKVFMEIYHHPFRFY